MPLPDPTSLHPITLPDGRAHAGTVHLARAVDHPNIDVGDWTYASAHAPPDDWASHLAPYLYAGAPDRLSIGRFCQIADGVQFVTAGANHATRGLTTYPFPIFDPDAMMGYHPDSRDTVVGHDVWLGTGAMVLAGARIGNGAIVGAGSVVRGTVPDYAVVIGNPTQLVRMRFDAGTVARLLGLAWWNWSADRIAASAGALQSGDIDAL